MWYLLTYSITEFVSSSARKFSNTCINSRTKLAATPTNFFCLKSLHLERRVILFYLSYNEKKKCSRKLRVAITKELH